MEEEKHLGYFDQTRTHMTSYQLVLQRYLEKEDKEKANDLVFKEPSLQKYKVHEFQLALHLQSDFTFDWQSELYSIELLPSNYDFCKLPFSLEAYFELYQDPLIHTFRLRLGKELSEEEVDELFDQRIGKLTIKTRSKGNPFKLPVNILDRHNVHIEAPKTVTIVIKNIPGESVICSGSLAEVAVFKEISNFQEIGKHAAGYRLFRFTVD